MTDLYTLVEQIAPLWRSLTGDGNRETLRILKEYCPLLDIEEVPTGTKCFDWEVPQEWKLHCGVLTGPDGKTIVSTNQTPLTVVGYSEGVNRYLTLDELEPHLYSLPEQPDAIPYVTSYYDRTWGFCLPHKVRLNLKPGEYHALIDAKHFDGSMTVGSVRLKGRDESFGWSRLFLASYICHPAMVNNEAVGPAMAIALAEWYRQQSFRQGLTVLLAPETIGAIYWVDRFLKERRFGLELNYAGFQVTCCGDDRAWSFLPSRQGKTLADRLTRHFLESDPDLQNVHSYSFLDRGSDERQWCSPGVDLPVVSLMRSKYGTYPEYHTHLDNMNLVSPESLEETFTMYKRILTAINHVSYPKAVHPCEPRLGKYGLKPNQSVKGRTPLNTTLIMDVLAYADGQHSTLDIAETIGEHIEAVHGCVEILKEKGLVRI